MKVSIGQRLGSFEVSAVLGKGGMGEVWRATDTSLGREVALKVLPVDFADDPDRHARFEREAKVLASLNHTNIASLHGLEHFDGAHVLVMELVEGEGLDEIIARGPVEIDEAITTALQIAEALEAAHEAGIVHRDLKPANIRVRPDSTVKVLDFGLAKAWEIETGDSSLSLSPTMTKHATAAGVILGTAAYMSPEQARGKQVDRRADIWAFGVVLWEMLTGGKLFGGETASDVMAGVLRAEIDLQQLPPTTPAGVRQLVRRCLERESRRRLRDIGDARIALEETLSGDNPDEETAAAVKSEMPRRSRAAAAWLAATITAAAIAAFVGYFAADRNELPSEPRHLTIQLPPEQRLVADGNTTLTFDPEGRGLVFSGEAMGRQMLFSRSLGESSIEPIEGTDDGQGAFFSPDGSWIGFVAHGRLMKVAADGGKPYSLADCQGSGGATWLPDNTLVFAPIYSDGLFRVSAEGGPTERLTTPDRDDGELGHWWPVAIPGDRRVIFTAFRTPVDRSRIGVLDLETLEVRWLIEGGFFGRLAPSGHLLYAKGQRIFAVPFDLKTATVTGPAVAMVDDLRVAQTGGFGMFAVSKRGDLAYVTESMGNPVREMVWFDRSGNVSPATEQRHRFLSVSLSPDEKQAAVTIQGESRDLWTYTFDRGTLSRLTSTNTTEFDPRWSPDGDELFYVVDRPPFVLHRISQRSPDSGQPIWDEPSEVDTTGIAVTPDGRWLAFVQSEAETRRNIYVRPLDGSEPQRAFRATRADETYPYFSPDGRWLCYQSDETGRPEIYIESFPGPGERFQVSADGGVQPIWPRNGDEIFFRHYDEFRVVETSLRPGGINVGKVLTLFSKAIIDRGEDAQSRTYDVTPSGDRILAVTVPDHDLPRRVEFVTGWTRELERLAPGGGH